MASLADEIKQINAKYDEVAGKPGPLSLPRSIRWILTPDRKVAEAAYERNQALKLAGKRADMANRGVIPKEDVDEMKFKFAKSRQEKSSTPSTPSTPSAPPGVLSAISSHIGRHKVGYGSALIGAGIVAGLAAASRKKKKESETPGDY